MVDPPRAWLEWGFPDATPKGVVGVWFAELSGDLDWSRRNALMDAFRSEMAGTTSDKVDIKEFQAVVRSHQSARNAGSRINAAVIVWGRVGKISSEETLSVYQTVIPHVDGMEQDQGPAIVTVAPHDRQITPEEKARQLRKIAKLIAAYTAVAQQDFGRAADLYETLLSDFPLTKSEIANIHFYAGLSRQFVWEADRTKKSYLKSAKEHYEYAAKNCRDDQPSELCSVSRVNLGVLYAQDGDMKRAIKYDQDAVSFADVDKHQILKNVAALYAQMGRFPEAEKNYREALRLSPNSSRGALGLASVLMAQDKLGEAEQYFRRAIKLTPNDYQPYFLLGECLIKEGRNAEGLNYQRQAAKIAPDKVFLKHPR